MSFCLNSKKGQQGSSMVEVMVALFVLVIGMLGVFSLQAKSTKFNQSAYYYTQAVYLANDIAERMRSSKVNLELYNETIPADPKKCDADPCTSEEIRKWHLWSWKNRVENTLPNGAAEITVTDKITSSVIEILVKFDDSKTDGATMDQELEADYTPSTQFYSLVMEVQKS